MTVGGTLSRHAARADLSHCVGEVYGIPYLAHAVGEGGAKRRERVPQ